MKVTTKTDIKEFPLLNRGKVRDIYDIDDSTLLIVTTDRMSAFDVIMNEPVPYKGVILNQITLFWMKKFAHLVKNHLIESDVDKFPAALAPYREELEGRSVLVKKAKPLPVECIVRGYITGSGWKDYKATGSVCGYKLPEGLLESARLEQPLFTPSTKAELGEHDENISTARAAEILGKDIANQIENIALALFKEGRAWAESRGIIIADTKFEFGMVDGELILIDEVLTPDSSRFWPAEGYKAGQSQPSFDKQYLRDWLSGQPWDKTPPPPALPKEVVEATQNKYLEAYRILTGAELALEYKMREKRRRNSLSQRASSELARMPALRPHHSAGGKPGDGNACRTRMADAIKPVRGNFRTTHYRPLQPGNRLSADGGREIHGSFRFACHWGSFSPAVGGPFSTQYQLRGNHAVERQKVPHLRGSQQQKHRVRNRFLL